VPRSDRLYCDYIRQEGVAAIRTVASTVITDSLRPVCVQYVRWQQQQQPEYSHGGGSQIKPTTAAHGKCFSEIRYAFHFQKLGMLFTFSTWEMFFRNVFMLKEE
jgi:hypothetical protein